MHWPDVGVTIPAIAVNVVEALDVLLNPAMELESIRGDRRVVACQIGEYFKRGDGFWLVAGRTSLVALTHRRREAVDDNSYLNLNHLAPFCAESVEMVSSELLDLFVEFFCISLGSTGQNAPGVGVLAPRCGNTMRNCGAYGELGLLGHVINRHLMNSDGSPVPTSSDLPRRLLFPWFHGEDHFILISVDLDHSLLHIFDSLPHQGPAPYREAVQTILRCFIYPMYPSTSLNFNSAQVYYVAQRARTGPKVEHRVPTLVAKATWDRRNEWLCLLCDAWFVFGAESVRPRRDLDEAKQHRRQSGVE